MVGRFILQLRGNSIPKRVHIVSATRLSERDFWRHSALGRSLKPWLNRPFITTNITYKNTDGLPKIYNQQFRAEKPADIIIFIHDDVWLDDSEWIEKALVALDKYDIIGVAGNTRISPNQPAWLFKKIENGRFIQDNAYLSGAVSHGQLSKGQLSEFGPMPRECELLDGVFLAVRSEPLLKSHVTFDERFKFHFYDMDFCRNSRSAGLNLGTWPIAITHQSVGIFSSTSWQAGKKLYFEKWKS